MARGLRGVRDDLSELGRHLLDIACFLHPLLDPAHTDSPPPTPPPRRSPSPLAASSPKAAAAAVAAAAIRVSDELVGVVREMAERPEAWIAFTAVAAVDDDFTISNNQRDHTEAVERLVPELAALRIRLCPSYMSENLFWNIYFRLLQPKLNRHDTEVLPGQQEDVQSMPESIPHVCEIESEKSGHIEGYQSSESRGLTKTESEHSIDQWVFPKSRSQQSIDQWSDIPSDVESFKEGKRYISSEEPSDVETANIVVMDQYVDSLLSDKRNLTYASSSIRRDSTRRKPSSSSSGNYSSRAHQPARVGSLSKKDSWDCIEDSEFEVLSS